MDTHKFPPIAIGDQLYGEDGGEVFGAVRSVGHGGKPQLLVNVEGHGDFTVPMVAVRAVHDGKVILDMSQLSEDLREAIRHAHDDEVPGL